MAESMLRSRIAEKLRKGNGILSLMSDLSDAFSGANQETSFLGGGNPARIEAVDQIFNESIKHLTENSELLSSLLGEYSGPIGNKDVRALTASYLGPKLSSNLTYENIAFFNGSQNAFSFLLNAFSGTMLDGSFKQICLPIVPEYIGYADQTWEDDVFQANLPEVETISEHRFRYKIKEAEINFSQAGCITISRPTNPTGNVISKPELDFLYSNARKYDIPLLIDLAYGNPFPNLIGNAEPVTFETGKILSLSFSKIGLPGVRFGIIIADPSIIETLSCFGAVGNLSTGNFGSELARLFWQNDTLIPLSNNILRPYYDSKREEALGIIEQIFLKYSIPYSIHTPDGGFFLWIHFPFLRIGNQELYRLCKEENVFIVSGHYFFPGLTEDFSHVEKCIRLTYCRSAREIARGADILAKFVSLNSSIAI